MSILVTRSGRNQNWHPDNLGRDVLLAHWWAGSLAAGAVTTWTDRIQGIAPTQASSSLRPVQSATSFNSAYPGVTGDGVDDLLSTTTNVSLLPNGATGGMFCALVQFLSAGSTSGNKVLVGMGGAGATVRALQRANSGNVNRFTITDGGTSLVDTSVNFSSPAIVIGDWSGTTESSWINGSASSPATATIATLNTATTRITMFASSSNINPGNYCLAELAITTTLTTNQRQQLEGYWAGSYGLTSLLPSNHPYKNTSP